MQYPNTPPTEKEFEQKVEELRQWISQMYPVTDEEFIDIKRRIKSNIVIKMDTGIAVTDKQPHKSWLPARRANLDFFFWKRYKQLLELDKRWNPRVTASLDRVSDEIIDLLGDPECGESFQRRGLVMGDVQSGKTANYTAICNKAADTGYRVIIVLAGIQENLRQQTQERLDMEFSGRRSEFLLDPKKQIGNMRIGVGKYGAERRIESFTSVVKDFDKNILTALNLSLHSVNTTVLFVVKKNKSILNNLINWLKNTADPNGVINLPMLLIDDEADNASINTNDSDTDPTAINDAIRRLLKLFNQTSYLGITATPYANIFIDPNDTTEMCGNDLFPRDFVYLLSPPTDYIGADKLFGDIEETLYPNAIEPLYPNEMNIYFPFGHKKDLSVTELPESMQEAMAYFLLVNGIRDMRRHKEHRSMMIHVSRFTEVQNQIRDAVNEWVIQTRSDLENYSKLPENISEKIPRIALLKSVWHKHSLGKKACDIKWHLFLSKYLFKAVAPINVRAVNQESGATSLDYSNHKSGGLRVIAIGGDSLSRGITLEGLCVSYFYRRSNMYDTLLQMGRWFGYRPDYSDLFKIWMNIDAIDWYGYITSAAAELKMEIARMKNANLTPMDFGLKVRQSPDSLLVTARNKMRSATAIERPVTLSARLLETPRLHTASNILSSNEQVFKGFVKRLSEIGQLVDRQGAKYFWNEVSKDEIRNLLLNFKTHPWQLNFQGLALADFVYKNTTKWDVVLMEGSGLEYNQLICGNKPIIIKPAKRAIKATPEQISISGTKVRVGGGGAARVGLSTEQRKEATFKFLQEHPKAKNIPDSAYLKVARPPILMLHVISVDFESPLTTIEKGVIVPEHLFALGLGIPGDGEEKIASYMVNTIEFRQYINSQEDDFL